MFEKSEIDTELHARLRAAGLNPLDPGGPGIEDLDIFVVIESHIDPAAFILQDHAKRRSGSRRPPDQSARDKTDLTVHHASDDIITGR